MRIIHGNFTHLLATELISSVSNSFQTEVGRYTTGSLLRGLKIAMKVFCYVVMATEAAPAPLQTTCMLQRYLKAPIKEALSIQTTRG